MISDKLLLSVLPDRFAVCRLGRGEVVPDWARGESLLSFTRTAEELSIVCEEASVPETVTAERGWRGLKVQGPLVFSMIGVMAELSRILAAAQVSIFVLSTYDTDYILVKEEKLTQAVQALVHAGHQVMTSPRITNG
ncbi:MAG TPA: ACT domain-containing protein [Anaerolineales bacterium]|nr:ACT domain-containing protein [Anaerolineales bacterium]